MMIGQAAGVTAALAIQEKVAVQQVSVKELQNILQKDGTILHVAQEAIVQFLPFTLKRSDVVQVDDSNSP